MALVVVTQLEHRHKRLGRDLHRAQLAHSLFALLLLFQQLLLTRDVTAVALGKHVLAHCLDRLTCNDLGTDRGLDRDLEQLTRDVLLESFRDLTRSGVRLFLVYDKGKCIHLLAVEQEIQLAKLAGHVARQLIVQGRIAARARLERIKEVVNDLVERQLVVQLDSILIHVLHINKRAASVLAQIHQVAHVLGGGHDVCLHDRLTRLGDLVGCGIVGGVISQTVRKENF